MLSYQKGFQQWRTGAHKNLALGSAFKFKTSVTSQHKDSSLQVLPKISNSNASVQPIKMLRMQS